MVKKSTFIYNLIKVLCFFLVWVILLMFFDTYNKLKDYKEILNKHNDFMIKLTQGGMILSENDELLLEQIEMNRFDIKYIDLRLKTIDNILLDRSSYNKEVIK